MKIRRAVDANVLVYAQVPSTSEHVAVRAWLSRQLGNPNVTLVLTPGTLHELLHSITDPKRFEAPLTMVEATAVVRTLLGASNLECLITDERALQLALNLIDRHRLGRKRLADTLLAATCLANGVAELATCNSSDFRIFPDLTLIDPRI